MTAARQPDPFDDAEIEAVLNSELWQRRSKVMFLRNGGVTWANICKELQISETTARKDYDLFCAHLNGEDRTHTIARHRAVIFDLQRSMYPRMMGTNGDLAVKAAVVVLKALERESKLLGLDSPTKLLAMTSNEDFANEAARLITSIGQLDADTLKELTRAQGHDPYIVDAEVVPDDEPAQPEATESDAGDGRGADGALPTAWTVTAAGIHAAGERSGEDADHHDGAGDLPGPSAGSDDSAHTGPDDTGDDDDWSNI